MSRDGDFHHTDTAQGPAENNKNGKKPDQPCTAEELSGVRSGGV
jgi:hypothetical protein